MTSQSSNLPFPDSTELTAPHLRVEVTQLARILAREITQNWVREHASRAEVLQPNTLPILSKG